MGRGLIIAFFAILCFNNGNLIVLLNGFQKKTHKTPKKEIDLALKLKDEYFNFKIKNNEQ